MKELMGILGNNTELPKHVREHGEVKKDADTVQTILSVEFPAIRGEIVHLPAGRASLPLG